MFNNIRNVYENKPILNKEEYNLDNKRPFFIEGQINVYRESS